MVVAKIEVSGTTADIVYAFPIPKGMTGARLQISYKDASWDSLQKTVVFRGAVTKDIVNVSTEVIIPAEVATTVGVQLSVGVYGSDAENNVIIPTMWVDLGRVCPAADPSGDSSTDPTLPVWAQMEQRFQKLMFLADNPQIGTVPDWAATEADPGYIKNRTHWTEEAGALTFDGDLSGKDAYLLEDDMYLVRVSDHILTTDELIGSSVTMYMKGEDPEEMTIEIDESLITDMSENGIPAISVGNAVFSLQQDIAEDGIDAKAGLYFVCAVSDGASVAFVKSLSCAYGEHIHKLNNKFLDLGWLPQYQNGTEVLLEESTQYFTGKSCQQNFHFLLQAGKHYTVMWDDVSYSCYAKADMESFWGMIYIGNRNLQSSSYEDTGEPFCVVSSVIANVLVRTAIYASGDATEHKCSISITDVIANRIPMEFMPQAHTMPTDLGKNSIVHDELVKAYEAFQKGAPVFIQYNNQLFRVLCLSCDLIDAMYDFICMTNGQKIMIWDKNRGWTEFTQTGFVVATPDYAQNGETVLYGKKFRFTVDENGTLISEDVTGTM